VPYLYSDADIAALMAQTRRLRTPLRAATIATLIGLLSVTGLRIGEAISLDEADFDVSAGLLRVGHAKGAKQRLIPLHPTTVVALVAYRRHRDQGFPQPLSPALFVSTTGQRLNYVNVCATFITLVRRAGLAPRPAPCRPRLHDLRHRMFITDAILNGLPPHIAQIVAGHADINVTMGYKAVYPDEAIQSHLAFLARRRALRPTEEYRIPTDEEWQEFLGHPVRTPQSLHRNLRTRVRVGLHPRARLPPMPAALARSRPTTPIGRDPRQPPSTHRRSRTRRLARRSRRTPGQPRQR
jgi:hypothetical protein